MTDDELDTLDLSSVQPTFVLRAFLEAPDDWISRLRALGCPLTDDPSAAHLFLTDIAKEKRAVKEVLELRSPHGFTIVKLDWIRASLDAGRLTEMAGYVLYESRPTPSAPPGHPEEAKPVTDPNVYALYACQRETPLFCTNEAFVQQLEEIKLSRLLAGDEVGVRAYATSIASIRAYPTKLTDALQLKRLHGCHTKMMGLLKEYLAFGAISEARQLSTSSRHNTLKLFFSIQGVGASTARQFYAVGYRSLQDVKTHYWQKLTKEQRIGLMYFEDFQTKLSRKEVSDIGKLITMHANECKPGVDSIIVGGYRRGKAESNDVDIVLSHRESTTGVIRQLTKKLSDANLLVQSITISATLGDRNEQPRPSAGDFPGMKSHGFDGLDKALTVWKSPGSTIHRRVDIIVAPWRFYGVAIVGWSGAATFERDLRRYAKDVCGLKFDSSELRDRKNGEVVDTMGESAEEMEQLVFRKLGLRYIHPTLRNTG